MCISFSLQGLSQLITFPYFVQGAVFDVETEILQTVLEGFDAIRDDDSEAIEKLTSLPRIIPKKQEFTDRRDYSNRRSGGSFRNRSRFDMGDGDDDDDISSYSSGSRYQNRDRYERSDRSRRYNNNNNNRDSRNVSYRQRDEGDFDRRSRQMKMSQFDEDY